MPAKPSGQTQSNPPKRALHTPPFVHGLIRQGFVSSGRIQFNMMEQFQKFIQTHNHNFSDVAQNLHFTMKYFIFKHFLGWLRKKWSRMMKHKLMQNKKRSVYQERTKMNAEGYKIKVFFKFAFNYHQRRVFKKGMYVYLQTTDEHYNKMFSIALTHGSSLHN